MGTPSLPPRLAACHSTSGPPTRAPLSSCQSPTPPRLCPSFGSPVLLLVGLGESCSEPTSHVISGQSSGQGFFDHFGSAEDWRWVR